MKKIYGMLALTALVGHSAFAQLRPQTERFPRIPASVVNYGPIENTSPAVERGTPVFTEDFDIGSAPGSITTGPTFTTSNGVWTTSGANGNIWKHTYIGSTGQYSASTPAFASATATSNGYMIFDADSANAAAPFSNFQGYLVSPVMDLSSLSTFKVTFYQQYRFCCGSALNIYMGVNDGNGNWTDYLVWNASTGTNAASANPEMVVKNVTAALTAGTPDLTQVQIRFYWDGGSDVSHYFWNVDDLSVESADPDELQISNCFIYNMDPFWDTEPINYRQYPGAPAPVQFNDLMMVSDVFNNGANSQTTVRLEGTIENSVPAVVYSGSDNGGMGTLASLATQYDTIRNIDISGYAAGTYAANFDLNYDNIGSDAITSNNSGANIPFTVGGYDYGRDNNAYTNGGLYGGLNGTQYKAYVMGNAYQIYTNTTLRSVKVAFSGYNSATTAGSTVYPMVYEHDPAAADIASAMIPVYDGSGGPAEIALAANQISTGSTLKWVDLVIPGGLALDAGKTYIVAVGTYGGADKVMVMNGINDHDYVTTFLMDNTNAWFYMTSTPKIRMNFDPSIGVDEMDEMNGLQLFQNVPNPTNGSTRIDFSLATSSEVNFEVVDITGKVVISKNLGMVAAGTSNISIDGSNLAAGVYYYSVSTGNAKLTRKLVITE